MGRFSWWRAAVAVACVVAFSSAALADWEPGDDYKMHFPQLPDPEGWDVSFELGTVVLADDWLCTESGTVDDIHLWTSWQGDDEGVTEAMVATIWSNNPQGPDGYSIPDQLLWAGLLDPDDWTYRFYDVGLQGWYDPVSGQFDPEDHNLIFQYNILGIDDPFEQVAGEIYWLGIQPFSAGFLGWKTSLDQFEDDAVWYDEVTERWYELRDPRTGESLDLAFVITTETIIPEPAGIGLLGLLGLVAVRRRRR